jgi:epsilon-lactone hydrolase
MTKGFGRAILLAAAGMLSACSTVDGGSDAMAPATPAFTPPVTTADEDGTITLNNVRVPLSPLLSEEGADFMREIILGNPWGTPLPDIDAERARQAELQRRFLAPMRQRYAVETARTTMGGVVVDVVTPAEGVRQDNAGRVLINMHGGGFTTGADVVSLLESIPMAALTGIKVVSVDYRLAPENAFPAASEDVAAVYRELLKHYKPEAIGIYGCSSGGFLTAQSIAWFAAHDLPRPAAAGVLCASLGGYFGGDASALAFPLNGPPQAPARDAEPAPPQRGYMDDASQADPLAYPAYSAQTVASFPPTLLISGTRSFEFSMALDSHNRLAKAGVESQFHGWDAMYHAFIYNSDLPEAREAYAIMAAFFDKHLAR